MVGEKKVAAARKLLETDQFSFYLRDGFQHRALSRDLNLLCLGCTEP